MTFITLGGTVLDFERYKQDVQLLAGIAMADLDAYFRTIGFERVDTTRQSYKEYALIYYNEQLDLQISVHMVKKLPEVFV